MREIEFRGKIRECDEWVYGSLVYIPFDDGSEYCCIMENNCDDEYLPYIDNNSGTFDGYMIPIDKETIGQYTGLCDKNGTKIFEGDLLYFYNSNHDEEDGVMEVIFEDGAFMISGDILVPFHEIYDWELEVVGNIHDNPELLGVKHDN